MRTKILAYSYNHKILPTLQGVSVRTFAPSYTHYVHTFLNFTITSVLCFTMGKFNGWKTWLSWLLLHPMLLLLGITYTLGSQGIMPTLVYLSPPAPIQNCWWVKGNFQMDSNRDYVESMMYIYIYICTIVWISFSPLRSWNFSPTYVSWVTYIMHLLVELQVLTCFQVSSCKSQLEILGFCVWKVVL
jgi:hypothetical protein